MPANDTEDYRYTVSVDVTDASRRSVSEEGSVQVARSPLRLFVEPENWVAAARRAGPPERHAPWTSRANRGPTCRFISKPPAIEGDVRTDARGKATWVLEAGKLPGAIQVAATAQDERGQTVNGDAWVWTAAGGFSAAGYSYADLEVIADKKTYEPGDTARLVLNTAHPGTAALLTIEGDELYHAEVVDLRERTTIVSLPILPAYRPDVYVSVSAVHQKTYSRKEVLLRVSPREQQLTVQVTADKKQYQPRETAVYTLRTLDDRGRPVDAEASLGLVDESIYSVRAESRYDALQAFYKFRPNAVQTNFSFPEIYLAGDAKDNAPSDVRKEFPDTATWLPVIRTGPTGRADGPRAPAGHADHLARHLPRPDARDPGRHGDQQGDLDQAAPGPPGDAPLLHAERRDDDLRHRPQRDGARRAGRPPTDRDGPAAQRRRREHAGRARARHGPRRLAGARAARPGGGRHRFRARQLRPAGRDAVDGPCGPARHRVSQQRQR